MEAPKDRRTHAPANSGATRQNTRPTQTMHNVKPAEGHRVRPGGLHHYAGRASDISAQHGAAGFRTERSRRTLRVLLLALLGIAVIAAGLLYALASNTVDVVSNTITHVFVTPAPVRPGIDDGNGTPVAVTFPNWEKKEPVNILLLGLDFRPEVEDTRADTQIIVHIDPRAKTASMISIPRDLWVQIPGYGEGRINSAFQHGDHDKVPGGGPGLAMATIQEAFGIKIDYFAQVDFNGFEKIVDSFGGVTIDVPRPLADNEYPFQSYGFTRLYVPAGLQHMDGRTALQYARSRHADSDIGRNSRQQQVLLALRQQGLNLNLIGKLPQLAEQLSEAVRTDLSLQQVGSLAQLAREIDPQSIQTMQINDDMVTQTTLDSGADVLIPDWDLIRPKIAQAFADPKLAKEGARLSVQNGTTKNGVARALGAELTGKGYMVADISAAPNQGSYPQTTIVDLTGGQKPLTLEALARDLNVDHSAVKQGEPTKAPVAEGKPVDFIVIAGNDQIK
ncbi:MAG: LCP family protein [Chloroflexota bacterium]|nr:LCP family protein [Chloroflexota bacterium]